MKYDITFSCGHTHTVDIYGSAAERERKIKWYEAEAVCPDCYKAKKDAEAAEGCSEVEMSYSEYKTNYASCKTKLNSYNKETKTIVVYVPQTEDEAIEAAKKAYVTWANTPADMILANRAEYIAIHHKYVAAWNHATRDFSREAWGKLANWETEYNYNHGLAFEI